MTAGSPVSSLGGPSEEELVAIVAAVEMVWPRPVVVEDRAPSPTLWRFSGRWWSKPHMVHRSRPWVERG